MRILILVLLAVLAGAGPRAAGADPVPGGNHRARLRANDAPIGGRFTIGAYFLDALDSTVVRPGPGRVLALRFSRANGKNSFVIPTDLAIRDEHGRRWRQGFVPVGEKRVAGLLPKHESRWALWWVPWGTDSLGWDSAETLELCYGSAKARFTPLDRSEVEQVTREIPWDAVGKVQVSGTESLAGSVVDAAAFDELPQVVTRRNPEYPLSAREFDFEGTVNVAVLVSEAGEVTDAYVLQSNAAHELNVAALIAAMEWTFTPGRKAGRPVPGVVVIPMRFSLGGGKR